MPEPLSDLQKWFHSALLQPEATLAAEAREKLVPNPRMNAERSLGIYQQSYGLRIASCMREQFPALCHALGEELFNDFVAEYIREAPPESYTLYDLGRRFTAFLDANRPDRDLAEREEWIDFVVDLSQFERTVFTRFDCPGAEEMELANPETPDADLRLNPSLAVGEYRFPVAQFYHEVREARSPSPPREMRSWVAIVRKDYLTATILLSSDQHRFLKVMSDEGTIERTIAALGKTDTARSDNVAMPWARSIDVRDAWLRVGMFVVAEALET